ncbi:NAD(P)/FAD-dependent oxidoreductase [Actinophytocola sp.]|uniref:flavin-containing monooxygenase n=1 Tax=Actinophytocola sp. TaxID=1872138 RepID=UPI0025B7BC16|nr:NAD(P)/FAD-dependent oxidoreductase [Actinophytocola sp.]
MTPDYDAIIVGAGFGGMGAAIQLNRLGVDNLAILERADDLGGTWHVNRYPGLAVDIASVTYSYSFEPNPYWSRMFAPGAELKRYAEHVADKYDLRRYMRFGTVVDGARWDDAERVWTVRVRGSAPVTARYLVTATGFLSQPRMPNIPGIDGFAGKVIHSTAWDDGYDLTARRAAVIGTGATAVQLVPEVARKVAELTVYQRTPIWVTPKLDGPIPRPVQRLVARMPLAQRAARLVNSAALEAIMVTGVLHYRQARLTNRAVGDEADRACRAERHRHRRRPPNRDRHPAARHGVPALPEPDQPQQSVLLQRTVVLHHDRGADAAHGVAVRRAPPPRRDDVRGDVGRQRRVPRRDDRPAGRLGCSSWVAARPRTATTSTRTARPPCYTPRRRSTPGAPPAASR